MTHEPNSIIYIQLPKKDPMDVIKKQLAEEEHFERIHGMKSFRAELIRTLLGKIETNSNYSR